MAPRHHFDECSAAMFRTVIVNRQGRKFSYYYHHQRRQKIDCRARVRADDLKRQIPGLVLRVLDGTYMAEVIEIPAEDHTAELEKLDTPITDWEARAIAGDTAESVMRILGGLHAKRRVLIDADVRTEARREVRYTDELMTDRWRSLETDHERGAFLRSMRIRIMARKSGPGKTRIRLQQGDRHWADAVSDETDAGQPGPDEADQR